jgi:hypothetical protein
MPDPASRRIRHALAQAVFCCIAQNRTYSAKPKLTSRVALKAAFEPIKRRRRSGHSHFRKTRTVP